jgi:hypothetical protein
MTIAVRNRVILAGTILIAVFMVIFLVSIALLFRTIPVPTIDFEEQSTVAPFAIAMFCEISLCAAASLVLFFSFRKTASAEIFLFILFLVSMSFDALKTLHIVFDVTAVPPFYGTLVARGIYFGRFFGMLCIFACGLFTTGMQYERLEIVLVSGILLSLVLAATIPIDMTRLEENFIMPTIYAREIGIVAVVLYLLALLNYLLAAMQTGNRTYLLICAGVAMAIVGRELVFYRVDGFSVILGFALLIAGSTLFGERTHEVHLWA